MTASQVHDLVEQQVIDDDEDDARGGGGEHFVQTAGDHSRLGQIAVDGARSQDREHRVAGVEDLDVPGPPLLQPVGDELRDGHQHGQLRW